MVGSNGRLGRVLYVSALILLVLLVSTVQAGSIENATLVPAGTNDQRLEQSSSMGIFRVFIEQNAVAGFHFPLGDVITMEVDDPSTGPDPDYSATDTVIQDPENPSSTVISWHLGDAFTVEPGHLVRLYTPTYYREHWVTNLQVGSVDIDADTVDGTTNPGGEVKVIMHHDHTILRREIADGNGDWSADFSVIGNEPDEDRIHDIDWGQRIMVLQSDDDSDATQIDRLLPNPNFEALPEEDQVVVYDWPAGALVTVTVDDPHTEPDPDYSDSGWPVPNPDDPGQTHLNFQLVSFDLQPGHLVTVSSSDVTEAHTVTAVTLTSVDHETNMVVGSAAPFDEIEVFVHHPVCCFTHETTADANGDWATDTSPTFDITPGTYGKIFDHDDNLNKTVLLFRVRDPHFVVWPSPRNSLHGWDWTEGATVTLTIDDPETPASPDFSDTAGVSTNEWGDTEVAWHTIDFEIRPGHLVTLADGDLTLSHTVTGLQVLEVQAEADTVIGWAAPGSQVEVDIWGGPQRPATAGDDGIWIANFHLLGQEEFDLVAGTHGHAEQWIDQAATRVDWEVPDPGITVELNRNVIHSRKWPVNALVWLAIDDPGNGPGVDYSDSQVATPPEWDSDFGEIWFSLADDFRIGPGHMVTLSDGGIQKSMTVDALVVTGVDWHSDVVAGTAPPGASITVEICLQDGCIHRDETADENGDWLTDFSVPGDQEWEQFTNDIIPWTEGSVYSRVPDGTSTQLTWPIVFDAWVPGDSHITGHNWFVGEDVQLTIEDPETAASPDYEATARPEVGPYVLTGVHFPLEDGFRIRPGQEIVMSQGPVTKVHVVREAHVSEVNAETDTISGLAGPEAPVYLTIGQNDANRFALADTDGNWLADFAVPDAWDERIYDIQPDTTGIINWRDDDGDGSISEWQIPLTCPPGDTISGTVYLAEGMVPLEGVTIYFDDFASGQTRFIIESGTDGTYACYLPTGEYRIWAFGGGYAREYYQEAIFEDAALVQVIETTQLGNVDFTLDTPTVSYDHLTFNMSDPLLSEPAVRLAIALGTDRAAIIAATFPASPIWDSYMPAGHWAYATSGLPQYDFDPQQAGDILTAAGWVDGDGDGVREKDGQQLRLDYYTVAGNTVRERIYQIFNQNMTDIGLASTLYALPAETYFADDGPVFGTHEFDIAQFGWRIDPNDDQFPGLPFKSGHQYNAGLYDNPVADGLLDDALATNTRAEKLPYLQEHQIVVMSDLATLPLVERIDYFNLEPVAEDDTYETDENEILVAAAPGVLANDSDPNGDPLTANLVDDVDHGSLTLEADGSFTYTPDHAFYGEDSFTYVASDGSLESNEATVTIAVHMVNFPPEAVADAYEMDEDEHLSVAAPGVLANDLDDDGDPLTAALVSDVSHGVLSLSGDGSFTYDPETDWYGGDQFSYLANDGLLDSEPALVTIQVNPVNDAPEASDDTYETIEDLPLVVAAPGALENDQDLEGDPLAAELVSGPDHGSVNLATDGSFTYTPDPAWYGTDTFTYVANDGNLDSDAATVAISVRSNESPQTEGDFYTIESGETLTAPPVETIDQVTSTLGYPMGIAVDRQGNVYVVDNGNHKVFKVAPDGTRTTLIGPDGDGTYGLSSPWDVAVDRVGNVYVSGCGSDNIFRITPEGAISRIAASYGDGQGNVLDSPMGLVVDRQGNLFAVGYQSHNVFKVLPGDAAIEILDQSGDGSHSFTYPYDVTVDESGNVYAAGSNSQNAFKVTPDGTISQIIGPSGDGTHALDRPFAITADGDGFVYVAGYENDNVFRITPSGAISQVLDRAGDGHPFNGPRGIAADGAGNVYVTGYGSHNLFQISPDGVARQILDSNGDGDQILRYPWAVAVDSGGRIYVTGASSQNAFRVVPGGVLANDADADGDSLTAALIDDVSHGVLSFNADGSFSYTPGASFLGRDNFRYRASDGLLESEITTVELAVTPANYAPTAGDDFYTIEAGKMLTAPTVETIDQITSALGYPISVDVDRQGNVYVVDNGSHKVFKVAPDGTRTTLIGPYGDGTYSLSSPWDVAVDRVGNVFVSGYGSDNIFRITPEGAISRIAAYSDGQGNILDGPMGLTVDRQGNLFVAGNNSHNVFKVLPGGAAIEILDQSGDGSHSFTYPRDVAVDESGNIYAAGYGSHNAFKVTSDGMISQIIGSSGDGTHPLSRPFAIAVDGNEVVYVAGLISDNVFRITPSGAISHVLDRTGDGHPFDGPFGIAADGADNIYVVGYYSHNLFQISPDGDARQIMDSDGDGSHQMYNPRGVAVDESGRIYVTAPGSGNAFRVTPGGVLADDGDIDGDSLAATLIDEPSHGTLSFSADGSFSYTPDAGFLGWDSFLYRASDGLLESNIATVDLAVTPANYAPTAGDDFYTIEAGKTLTAPPAEAIDLVASALGQTLGVDVDRQGNVYAVDYSSYKVLKVAPDGTRTTLIGPSGDGTHSLTNPWDVAVDRVGNVFVSGYVSDNVFKITPDGTISRIAASYGDRLGNILDGPMGLAVDRQGNLFVVGNNSHNVFKVLPGGAAIEILNQSGDGSHSFTSPYDVAVDESGNVYAAGSNSRNAFKVTPGGAISQVIGPGGDGTHPLYSPFAVTVDPDGVVYVADRGGDAVFRITPGGAISQVLDRTGDGHPFNDPLGIAADGAGNVYVTGRSSHNLFQVSPDGTARQILDRSGDGAHQSYSPWPVAVDTSGRVYVGAESSGNVFRVTPGGALANDPDVDGDTLAAYLIDEPSHGTLSFNADGSFSYTPDAGFLGQDSFRYQNSDSLLESDAATVTIDVTPDNYAPAAFTDAYPLEAGGTLEVPAADMVSELIGGLSEPFGIDVDQLGNVYVADRSSHKVFKVTPDGSKTKLIGPGGDGVHPLSVPWDVVVDHVGNVYVSGFSSHNVFKITVDGAISQIIDVNGDQQGNQLLLAIGLAVDQQGNVYVAGLDSRNVFKVSLDGTVVEILDASGDGSHALRSPYDITVDPLSNVYVAGVNSNNVFKVTPEGVVSQIVDVSGDGIHHLRAPNAVAVDSDGTVYIGALDSDNVFRISTNGSISQVLDRTGDGHMFENPFGLAVDGAGNLYVAGRDSNNLFQVSPDGIARQILDASGDGIHPLRGPWGVACDGRGTVYVSGWYSGNIFRVKPGGSLANDEDVDGDALSAVLVNDVDRGTLLLNADGSFNYTPDPGYLGLDSFTYRAHDGALNSDPVQVTIAVTLDNDGDGITAVVEEAGPNGGDGNDDGIPDAVQGNVTSLPNAVDGAYLTIEATGDSQLAAVHTIDNPSPADAPTLTEFPIGFLAFDLAGLEVGEATLVILYLPPTPDLNTYWRYGPTPENPDVHWYRFDFDGQTGAQIVHLADQTLVYLRLVDGARGDSDLTADGRITDPGAPAVSLNQPPVAVDDDYVTDEDTPLTIEVPGVLANDTDEDGDPITAMLVEDSENGTLTFNADGSFTYTPDPDWSGTDYFTYLANDGQLDSEEEAVVTITVAAVNDLPVATAAPAEQTVQYSDPIQPVTIEVTDVDSAAITATVSGLPDGLAIAGSPCDVPCTLTISGFVTGNAGIYQATVTLDDGPGTVDVGVTIIVEHEDAAVTFDSANEVAFQVNQAGGAAPVELSLLVREVVPDLPEGSAAPGDIANAEVTMTLVPVGPGANVSGVCLPGAVTGTDYDAVLPFTCTFSGVEVNTYTAEAAVTGGYYVSPTIEDVVVVYDPSLGFTTGGGWFYWPGTNEKTNFGYTMQYNKKGGNVKGSLLLIRHLEDGSIYRVKSNALYGLALGQGDGFGWATFSGKATYLEPGMLLPEGNHEFVCYVEDYGEPGGGDQVWLEMHDKDGNVILALSMPRPATNNAIAINGGNIVVPH